VDRRLRPRVGVASGDIMRSLSSRRSQPTEQRDTSLVPRPTPAPSGKASTPRHGCPGALRAMVAQRSSRTHRSRRSLAWEAVAQTNGVVSIEQHPQAAVATDLVGAALGGSRVPTRRIRRGREWEDCTPATNKIRCARFVRQRPGRPLAPLPLKDENPWCRRVEAGEAWCGSWSPCDSVAQEPVEPLIAAMSAKARLMSGRLLPAAHIAPSIEEAAGRS